jgi:hypothetical protein
MGSLYQSKFATTTPSKKDPYGNVKGFLATSLTLNKPAQKLSTPKFESTPSLVPYSSSPASSEVITPEKTLSRRVSFKERVHQKAAEAFKETTGMLKALHFPHIPLSPQKISSQHNSIHGDGI